MANKVVALTSKLEWHNGTAYAQVLQLTELNGPGISVSSADSSTLDAALRTDEPVMVKHGPITFRGLWDPDDTVHQALRTDAAARTKRQAKITNSDATPSSIEFATASCWIENFDVSRGKDGLLEFSGSINCNVAPTIA